MSGNATEEGVLTQLNHPGHMDASRLAGLSGSLAAVFLAMVLVALVGPVWALVLGTLLGLLVGGLVFQRLTRRQIRRQAARMQAARERDDAEAEMKIAAMKAPVRRDGTDTPAKPELN